LLAAAPLVAEVPRAEENDLETGYQADNDWGDAEELAAALDGLSLGLPLNGVPPPRGRHVRFSDDGTATESPRRVLLRGMPRPIGKYTRFAEE
jgi:hypothetical protein